MCEENKSHHEHFQYLKNLDKVHKAIQGTSDLQQMLCKVLDVVLSILGCDRAFMIIPCDPDASSWRIPIERTNAEYPGAQAANLQLPMTAEVAKTLRILLDTDGPVIFGPDSEYMLPPGLADPFNSKSYLGMAIYPKVGKPWQFGMHQCSHARIWTKSNKELFAAVGHRIADGLSLLLSYQELRENRLFLDNIFENLPNMVFVKDAQDLRFVRFNKASEQLLGYSQDELLGKNDFDFFTEEEAFFFTAKDREALERNELVDIPEEAIHTKYGERVLHTKKIPLSDKAGNPAYLLGISEDITERKLMDQALQSSEELLLLAVEAAQMGLWDWNIVTGTVVWSDQCKAHYGISPETPMSHELFLQALHPNDRDRVDAALKQAVEERTSYNDTKRTIWPDGSTHWTHSRAQVHCDSAGKPVRMVGITFDVTERKRVKQELLNSELKLTSFIANLPAFFFTFQKSSNGIFCFPYASPGIGELYGLNPEDIREDWTPLLLMSHLEDRPHIEACVTEAFQTLEPFDIEFRVCLPGLPERWIEARAIAIQDTDGKPLWHGIMLDITERKLSEMKILASEQLFRALVENSPDFIARYDRGFRRIYVNPAMQKLFQSNTEEVLGETPHKHSPVYAPDLYIGHLKKVIETSVETSFEMPFRTPQGEMHWGHMRFIPEFGPDGQVSTVLAVGRNINQIKENEQRFRTLSENFPDFVTRFNCDGQYTYANLAIEKAFGIPTEAFLGKTLLELPQPEQQEQNVTLMALIRRAFAEGVANDSEASWDTQLGKKPFKIRHVPEKDETGNVISVLSIAHDITERKLAEQERLAHLRFFECMEQINRVIQGTNDLEQMMHNLLDVVLAIFTCDRTWVLSPCDPETGSYRIPYERTTPEYPGALEKELGIPVDKQQMEVFHKVGSSNGPVVFYPDSSPPLPIRLIEQFQVKAQMSMAIYPKGDKPYMFGLHQCSQARIWTGEEERLFQAIGRRLADALTSLLAQNVLRESEKKYRLIAENTGDVISVYNLNLKPRYVSPSIINLRGYTADEAMNQQLEEILTPQSLKTVRQVLAHYLELEKDRNKEPDRSVLLELEEYHKDGHTIWVELGASLIRDKDLQLTGILTVTRDITQRKKSELQLIESEHRFRSLAESSPDNIMQYDQEGRLVYINSKTESTIGIDFRSLIGKIPEEHPYAEATKGYREKLKKVIKTGKPDEIELEVPNTKGEMRTHHICFATERNNKGQITGALSIGRDITERKRIENELRKFSHAVEQSPVSIVIADVEGNVEFINTTFTEITGYTYADVLGQHTRIFKSGETSEEEYRQLWKTISSGRVWRGEFQNRKKDGELFWEQASIAPVKDTDNIITHYVAVKEDITEQKKLEEQLRQSQKMDAVGQLAGGVAHDFNNMLGVIIGHTELILAKETMNDSLRKHIKEIREAGFRSTEITRQLLAFARKQTIVPKILDLNDTLEAMLKLLIRLIGEDINLVWRPETNLWRVKIDPSQIDQILVNLCVNAKDAIGGTGKITIETQDIVFDDVYCDEHRGFVPGEYVMLAVSDNGIGLDKQTKDKIFEPFFTTKEVGKGTGLGLAMVYGIVKQNRGFINVYSEPRQGTTIKIYIPRHKGVIDSEPKVNSEKKALGGNEIILVVEDEYLHLKMVKDVLEKYGYRVLAASSPSEARRVLTEHIEVDLLLSDVILPEMNGPEFAKEINILFPNIISLFMSGYTGNVIVDHGVLEEGFNFIQKPFSIQELVGKVRQVLDGK